MKSADQLNLSPEVLNNFFISSSEGLALISQDGVIEFANQSFAKIFKYDLDQLIGEKVEKLIPASARSNHEEHRKNYNRSPEERSMGKNRDLVGLRSDGTKVPIEVSLSPIKQGSQQKVAVLISDITERKKIQEELSQLNINLQEKVEIRAKELEASQNLYSLIAQNFPNGTISVFDKNLNYIFVEGQELKKMGITSRQMQGTSFLDRIPHDIHNEILSKFELVYKGETQSFSIEINDNIYEITAVPLETKAANSDQILVVERNVTREIKAKSEMEKALAKEIELNELKSRFVSMASHEFRTPLTTINSSAELIEKYIHEEDQGKRLKHTARIQSSVTHLTGLLNDILTLSKLEEGLVNMHLEKFNLKELLDDLQDQMVLFAKGKVEFNLQTDPSCSEYVTTDKKLVRNVLLNLISNAVKYSNEDGIVDIHTDCKGGRMEILIRDYGIGIPLEDQKNLFQRFFRASNVINIEGTGLGLHIVKRMIVVLKGNITFKSTPGEGTEFCINIPYEK